MFWFVDGVWRVHFLVSLIGQTSGWSRYDRLHGVGVAPETILITATCSGGWRAFFRASDWSEVLVVTLRLFTRTRSGASNHINYSHMCIVVSSEIILDLLIGQSSD